MEPHWRVSCVLEDCEGRIVWRPGQPSRWLDEQAQMQRGQIQHGWCEACAAHYEQRSTSDRHDAVAGCDWSLGARAVARSLRPLALADRGRMQDFPFYGKAVVRGKGVSVG